MRPLKRAGLAVIGLAIGVPLLAWDEPPGEIPADEPVRVEASPFHPPVRLKAADGVIDSGASWGHSSPWVVDIDGDGKNDLIVGDFSGFFRFYKNEGTNQEPRYAKAVNLKAGGVDAQVPIY
jgi:hypothetical protein